MRQKNRGVRRCSLALVVALASISLARAGACTPDLTHYTPTPTLTWSESDLADTAGFRVYWKRAEDTLWRGSIDIPAWQGDSMSGAVWPGMTEPWPLQRLVPDTEQGLLVDIQVAAYNTSKVLGTPSTILRLCMPQIWAGGHYQ
ncbi:MAG TPA: hypothetical protein VFV19_16385 [Candidatus Polarisedimenticolaceae bacterium]|nr:hypothetical protein [Candidatus Polarisedimenticolaceae bacterium]